MPTMDFKDQFIFQDATTDGARRTKLSRSQKFVLGSFLLLQVVHSILFVVITIAQFKFWDFSFGSWGWKMERLVAALISMVLGVLILRETIGDKRRAWGLTLMLVIDVACYGFWAWTSEAPLTKIILTAQLVLAPFVLVALRQMMRRCGVTIADLSVAASAFVIAAVVVFVRGTYYPVNSPYWYPMPPLYYRLLTFSDFHWPQEKSLALLMTSYLALSWISEMVIKAWNKARGTRPQ
jgi:hypothetical protein